MKIFLILSLFFHTATTTSAGESRGLFSKSFFSSATTSRRPQPLISNNVNTRQSRVLQSYCTYDDARAGTCSLQQYCEANYVNTDTLTTNITFTCQGNINGAWTFAGESRHDHVECYYENGRSYHSQDPNRPANDEGLKYCFSSSGFAVISFVKEVALEVYTVGKYTQPLESQIKGWFPVSLCADGESSDFEFAGVSYCSALCPTRLEVGNEPCDLGCQVCEGDWSSFQCFNFEPTIDETCDVDGVSFEEQVAVMMTTSNANNNYFYHGGSTTGIFLSFGAILSMTITVWMGF